MNKYQEYQEALGILRNIELLHNYKKIGCSLTPNSDLLQELVDKETPKTPHKRFIFSDNEITMPLHFCDCEKVVHLGDRYCSNCGQKLDWR